MIVNHYFILIQKIKDGKIQPDAVRMVISKPPGKISEKKLAKISEFVNECQSIIGLRCEQAAQLKKCLDKSMLIRSFN